MNAVQSHVLLTFLKRQPSWRRLYGVMQYVRAVRVSYYYYYVVVIDTCQIFMQVVDESLTIIWCN